MLGNLCYAAKHSEDYCVFFSDFDVLSERGCFPALGTLAGLVELPTALMPLCPWLTVALVPWLTCARLTNASLTAIASSFRKSNLESRKAPLLTKPASARQTQEESSWPQGLARPLIGQKLLQFLKRFSFGGQRVAGPSLLNRCERNAKLGGNLLLCVSSFGGEVFELLNESTKLFFFSCETSGLSLVKRVSFWHTLGPNAGSRIPCARWS
jgi:hypothetical protein